MSEMQSPNPDIPEVSPAQRYEHEANAAIAEHIVKTLDQMGINPDSIVLAGYDEGPQGNKEPRISEKNDLKEELQALAAEANERFLDGEFESNPALREHYMQKTKELKARIAASTKSVYSFAEIENLTGENEQLNPLTFAGHADTARIGVYDKEKLLAIDPQAIIADIWSINATREEIDSAKVAILHPKYTE